MLLNSIKLSRKSIGLNRTRVMAATKDVLIVLGMILGIEDLRKHIM